MAAVVALALVAGASAAHAGAAGVPGDVVVEGLDVPVRATFSTRGQGEAEQPPVDGVVHGVRRVDGGTVLYVSLGIAASFDEKFYGSSLSRQGVAPYERENFSSLLLVDRNGGKAYRPLPGPGTTSPVLDLQADPGELAVMYAVFPELPPSTAVVDLFFGGEQVGVLGLPVEEGALAPVVDEVVPQTGTGWPRVPSGASLGEFDPTLATFDLVKWSESAATVTAETGQQVDATLDANVLFDKSSAVLTPAATDVLARVAQDIAARGRGEVLVTGHTDSDGSDASNQALSEQRAAAVVEAIRGAAGDAVTFTAVGRGESVPAVPNDSPENMQINRRVEISYQVEDQ